MTTTSLKGVLTLGFPLTEEAVRILADYAVNAAQPPKTAKATAKAKDLYLVELVMQADDGQKIPDALVKQFEDAVMGRDLAEKLRRKYHDAEPRKDGLKVSKVPSPLPSRIEYKLLDGKPVRIIVDIMSKIEITAAGMIVRSGKADPLVHCPPGWAEWYAAHPGATYDDVTTDAGSLGAKK